MNLHLVYCFILKPLSRSNIKPR